MSPIILIDGNNLGHVLGFIDKAADHYDSAALLACLDGVAHHLAAQGREVEIVLFLDDVSATERMGGWHVQVPPIPRGDADAAIRSFAQAHAARPQILVSGDRALCGDVAMSGAVCLSPQAFISRYLYAARQDGFIGAAGDSGYSREVPWTYVELSKETPPAIENTPAVPSVDRGKEERQRQAAALARAEAILRGEPLPPPEVFKLNLSRWSDAAELALYLTEHHLCPDHPGLTTPDELIAAIREHCSRQPRYFTSGRIINRVFRLFLCRPEGSLSLDDLTQLAKTRRRKIRAAIAKSGEQLGIVAV